MLPTAVRPRARLPRLASPVRVVLLVLPLVALIAATSSAGLAPAALAAAPAPRVTARMAVLIDGATGAVIWQRSAHRATLVASTTKILTALVAENAYATGKVLAVPRAAENVDGTRFGYQIGMRLRRNDLLTTLLMVSANDAAETLAGAYPRGGRAGFVAAMQEMAESLGCTDSIWRDPSGLDAPGHRGSAADLAILGRALLARPDLAKIVATPWTRYRWPDGRVQVITNHNHLVSKSADPGAIGIKTGYTVSAHSTIVAAERRGGRTLIAVALGTDAMYQDVRSMFAYGFATRTPPGAEVLGRNPASGASFQGPTRLQPTPDPSGNQIASSLPATTNSLLSRLLPARVPALAALAIALLVLGVVVTALSRPKRGRR